MKNVSSKQMNNNKEKTSLTRKTYTVVAIVIITIAIIITPWLIYQYIPAMSAILGYTGDSFCANPYVYPTLIGIAVMLSVSSLLLSRLLVKGPSQWKVLIIFEAVVILNAFIAALLNHSLCDGSAWKFM